MKQDNNEPKETTSQVESSGETFQEKIKTALTPQTTLEEISQMTPEQQAEKLAQTQEQGKDKKLTPEEIGAILTQPIEEKTSAPEGTALGRIVSKIVAIPSY